MAKQLSSTGKAKLWNNPELRKRFLFLLGALIVFRIGAHVPVPGVDAAALAKLYRGAESGILGMLNMFSGGSLERFSIFAIGIMPYISSSIIVQLASEIVPSLKALKKEGDVGRKVITKYTRLGTVFLAAAQSFGVASFVMAQPDVVVVSRFEFFVSTVTCLVGGTMFLMWLGEQITERGIGNGISLLISAGIVAGIPPSIVQLLALVNQNAINSLVAIGLVLGVLLLTYVIVYFESALRKVPIQYAKRQVVSVQNTHMPFKLNMAGVIPPIFASSVIMLPSMFIGWFGSSNPTGWANYITGMLQHGKPVFMVLFSVTIIFFCYFYTALTFSPKEMAENLKKSGAFVPGIRPGEQTAQYLEKVVVRLTLFGSLYITAVCLIPELLTNALGVSLSFGGTSLLILVVITLDFRTQIASYQMTQRYDEYLIKRSGN